MTVYSEETLPIPVGLGIDSYNHPANIADGFCTIVDNFLAKGDRLITRKGLQPPGAIDTREPYVSIGVNNRYTKLPNSSHYDWPVAMWSGPNGAWAIRQFNRNNPANSDGQPGVARFPDISGFKGACVYLDKVYVLSNAGIESIANWNWAIGSVTKTAISNTYNVQNGPFVFKDRLWGWDDTKIYYTDPPNAPGAYPETWDMNGKFIVIGAGSGMGKIFSVIPVGTKLFVFTASGLYNVSVLGSPQNWVVRLMDATVKVNSYNCAYEDKGIIFFVDTRGVWVTNQDEVKMLSEPIQNLFQDQITSTYFIWKLFPFAEGILLLRQKVQVSGTYPSAASQCVTEAKIFYTRLDNIAWSEVSFDTGSQPGDILAGFSNLESHLVWAPNNYLVLAHGNSISPIYNDLTSQLLIYQGFQDQLTKVGAGPETLAVSANYTSKVVRGQMTHEKRGKYAYINFSTTGTPGADMNMDYQWDTEQEVNRDSDTVTVYDVISAKEGLVKIKGPEFFRHLQFKLTVTLDTAIREYTILGSALILHTHRNTPRRDS